MIGGFQTGGATNINDAIFLPAQYLLNAQQKDRRVIILISDDVGTSAGGQGARDIVTEAIASDAVVQQFENPRLQSPGNAHGRGHDTAPCGYPQSRRTNRRRSLQRS
jgi:hypothetical protein